MPDLTPSSLFAPARLQRRLTQDPHSSAAQPHPLPIDASVLHTAQSQRRQRQASDPVSWAPLMVPRARTLVQQQRRGHAPALRAGASLLQYGFMAGALNARTQAVLEAMPCQARMRLVADVRTLCRHFVGPDAPVTTPTMLAYLWDVAAENRAEVLALCAHWMTPSMRLPYRMRMLTAICSYPAVHRHALFAACNAFVLAGLSDTLRLQVLEAVVVHVAPFCLRALMQQTAPVVEQLWPEPAHVADFIIYIAKFSEHPEQPALAAMSAEDEESMHLDMVFGDGAQDTCCPITDDDLLQDLSDDETDYSQVPEAERQARKNATREGKRQKRLARPYNTENVMRAGRNMSTQKSIDKLRRQVHNPLDMLTSLKIIENYLRNIEGRAHLCIGELGT